MSSETEQYYVDQMVKAAPEYEKDIREVMRRSDETIEKTDYAETWVRYLKDKGYHVYILSNYATDTLERTEDKLTFLKYVDGAVLLSGEADQTGTGNLQNPARTLPS